MSIPKWKENPLSQTTMEELDLLLQQVSEYVKRLCVEMKRYDQGNPCRRQLQLDLNEVEDRLKYILNMQLPQDEMEAWRRGEEIPTFPPTL